VPINKTYFVVTEHRSDIDQDRKYTIARISQLRASSTYVFTFFAKNEVGLGTGEEKILQTRAISKLRSLGNAQPLPHRFVHWSVLL